MNAPWFQRLFRPKRAESLPAMAQALGRLRQLRQNQLWCAGPRPEARAGRVRRLRMARQRIQAKAAQLALWPANDAAMPNGSNSPRGAV